jgi:hypothetical protein
MKSIQPDNRPAWSQQRGESAESFAVFVIYRDLGPDRSLAEAQRLKGKPQDALKTATGKRNVSGCMKRWSRRWAWADRAAAWDVMLEAERTAAVRVARRRVSGSRPCPTESALWPDYAAHVAAAHAHKDDEGGDAHRSKGGGPARGYHRAESGAGPAAGHPRANGTGAIMLRRFETHRR